MPCFAFPLIEKGRDLPIICCVKVFQKAIMKVET